MTRKIFAIIILSTILITGCIKNDSPEDALNDITISLAERDLQKLSARADLDEFFSKTHDAITVELAKNYDAYKEKYPDDLYFQHSAEFLKTYNAENKKNHLEFLNDVKNAFFNKIPAPETPQDNPAAYVANEFEKIRQATRANVKKILVTSDVAVITLEISGDGSLYGKFIGQMTLELGFYKDAENFWHFDEIINLDELTPAFVDKAEILWINF